MIRHTNAKGAGLEWEGRHVPPVSDELLYGTLARSSCVTTPLTPYRRQKERCRLAGCGDISYCGGCLYNIDGYYAIDAYRRWEAAGAPMEEVRNKSMNSKEYDVLSDDEKRIKVAELRGYIITNRDVPDGEMCWRLYKPGGGSTCSRVSKTDLVNLLPDYTNDLNAMHEAEKALTMAQQGAFRMHLNELNRNSIGYVSRVCHATSAQRAKAFVMAATGE